jgi:membrane protein
MPYENRVIHLLKATLLSCWQWLQQCGRFWWFVLNNFIEDDCSYRASALTFTSLLAIVPLMSTSFALLSAFPVFQELAGPIQDFIFENFVPATGKAVQQYLATFANQVSKLSIFGVAFLFVTAVLVMFTIEQSMNRIWKVRVQRRGSSAFLLYWAILSLAPALIGLSVAASSYLISLPLLKQQVNFSPSTFVHYMPLFLSLIGFTFLYLVVPNSSVKIRHGLAGALVAAALFEGAKQGFAYYLSQFHTYQLLYGAFAIVPIFFLWVYWVWFIILLGAEVSYALSVHHHRRVGPKLNGFSHTLNWLYRLWYAQQKGEGVSLEQLIDADDQPYEVAPEKVLEMLLDKKFIQSISGNRFILSRSLSKMSIYQLMKLLPYPLPDWQSTINNPSKMHQKFFKLLKENDAKDNQIFSISLDELFS